MRHTVELIQPSPVDSMREAVFTVSPNRQYLGIACPTTPVYVAHVVTTIIFLHNHYFYTFVTAKDYRQTTMD